MLKFKQYLILEDAEITLRGYLESVYGKSGAESMISSIRKREEQFREKKREETRNFLNYGNSSSYFPPGFGKDTDVVTNPYAFSDFKNFKAPIYSDKNLDRPIDVKLVEMEPHPELVAAGYTGDMAKAMATGSQVGVEPENKRGSIDINKDADIENKDRFDSTDTLYDFTKRGRYRFDGQDTVGHELTHTAQSEFGSERDIPITKTEYGTYKPASKETLKRREYTQNRDEPAARMSELKHLYYLNTMSTLPADMTPEQKESFKSWYNKSKYRSDEFDDTVQLLDTPEGDELFRRVAKANKSNTSDTRMT